MDLGLALNSTTQYFSEPQTLNSQGWVEGHIHLAVQRLADLQNPPDAKALAFFISLSQEDTNGILSTVIPTNTLNDPGTYHICSVSGTRAHQPPLMPLARRGDQDDCICINII